MNTPELVSHLQDAITAAEEKKAMYEEMLQNLTGAKGDEMKITAPRGRPGKNIRRYLIEVPVRQARKSAPVKRGPGRPRKEVSARRS